MSEKPLRTKFTVIFEAKWKYNSKAIDDVTGLHYFYRGSTAFKSEYYYLGWRIDECLRAFQNYWDTYYDHSYFKNESKYYVIKEIKREENIPHDYSCGHTNSLCGGELVVTQIVSDRIFTLWNPKLYKVFWITLDNPRDFTDDGGYIKYYYGKGMENIQIGDIVEYTGDRISLISDICGFYNVTGKNDIDLAKKMYDYMTRSEQPGNPNPYDYPGKYTGYGINRLKEQGIPIVIETPYDKRF